MSKARKKKFTVGLWITSKDRAGKPLGFQIWNIQKGEKEVEGMEWFVVVSAIDDKEALQLAQDIYAGKIEAPEGMEPAEAEAA